MIFRTRKETNSGHRTETGNYASKLITRLWVNVFTLATVTITVNSTALRALKVDKKNASVFVNVKIMNVLTKPTALARTTTTVSETPPIAKAVLIVKHGRALVADFDGKKIPFSRQL